MSRHLDLISMATRFDLGQGVELIRIPSIYANETNPRWYVTRGNDYILHRRMGWLRYDAVADGDFLFPDAEAAFTFYTKAGCGVYEQHWQNAKAQDQEDMTSEVEV